MLTQPRKNRPRKFCPEEVKWHEFLERRQKENAQTIMKFLFSVHMEEHLQSTLEKDTVK